MKNRTYSILIIDDAYFLRNVIKKAIALKPNDGLDFDFEISTEAQNGEEGLELYQIVKPDIVTVDINMPKLNGIEFVKKLKKINPYAKIIVISANLASEYKDKVIEAGAFDYIQKPFQNSYLWTRLDSIAEELKEESFNISKFSMEKNNSNVTMPITNNKKESNIKNNSHKKSNKKDKNKGDDLFSNIVTGNDLTEDLKPVYKNKKKNTKDSSVKKEEKNTSNNSSFLDSLIVSDNLKNKNQRKNTNIEKNNPNSNNKNYGHKNKDLKVRPDKTIEKALVSESLEVINESKNIEKNETIKKDIINTNQIIKETNEITHFDDKDEVVEINIEKKLPVDDISSDIKYPVIDDSKAIEIDINEDIVIDGNEDIVLDSNGNIIADNTKDIIINDSDDIIVVSNEDIVINDNDDEIIIDDSENIIIDDNSDDIVVDNSDDIVIVDNEDVNIEIQAEPLVDIVQDNENIEKITSISVEKEPIIDEKLVNVNDENFLENNIAYDIDEYMVSSKISFTIPQNIKDDNNEDLVEKEPAINENQAPAIDFRSPFSSENAEFIFSDEQEDDNADIVHEKPYKNNEENILYNYNTSEIKSTPVITPPTNNKYTEIYNEKMEREYNVKFEVENEPEEKPVEKKKGFFARLFGRKKKKKEKKKK